MFLLDRMCKLREFCPPTKSGESVCVYVGGHIDFSADPVDVSVGIGVTNFCTFDISKFAWIYWNKLKS